MCVCVRDAQKVRKVKSQLFLSNKNWKRVERKRAEGSRTARYATTKHFCIVRPWCVCERSECMYEVDEFLSGVFCISFFFVFFPPFFSFVLEVRVNPATPPPPAF